MKKRILVVGASLVLALNLVGCGGLRREVRETTEATTETKTEATTEESTTEVTTEAIDLSGYNNMSNVYYLLGDYEYYSEKNGTEIYRTADATESFAIYVQNETAYSASDMQQAYKEAVMSTYGENYTESSYVGGDLEWTVYQYTEDNDLDSTCKVNVYVYSDGATTIYTENAVVASQDFSGKFEYLLDSIIISDDEQVIKAEGETTGNVELASYDGAVTVAIGDVKGYTRSYECEYFIDFDGENDTVEYALETGTSVDKELQSRVDFASDSEYGNKIINQDKGTCKNDAGQDFSYIYLEYSSNDFTMYEVTFATDLGDGNVLVVKANDYSSSFKAADYEFLLSSKIINVKE